MSAINIRLPQSLHDAARELARQENVSLNQLITLALAEKIAVLQTQAYLGRRAEKGSRAKFEAALANVADVEADEQDRIERPSP
jgi:hypothetical protein